MADPEHIRVRVARGSYRYDGEHFAPGDELEVRAEVLERHPQTLEQVNASESTGSEAEDEDEDEDEALEVSDAEDEPAPDNGDGAPEGLEASEAEAEDEAELADEDEEICGAMMSNGAVCERPAGECPYHGSGAES